jgi:hypothetical protein
LAKNVEITDYQFAILDRDNKDKIIDTINTTNGNTNYTFPTKGNYSVQLSFLTEEDKQGGCESKDIQVGVSDFQINYDMFFKSPQSPEFQKVEDE